MTDLLPFRLIEHGKKRCLQRKIEFDWIAKTLTYPARIESDKDDPDLITHALLIIPERGFRVLRVIFNETVEPIAVVTAYFDDEVKDL